MSNSEELKALHRVGKTIVSSLDIEVVLKKIMEQVSNLFSASNWSLILADEKDESLYFAFAVGKSAHKLLGKRLSRYEGICGWVIETGEPVIIEDVSKDERFSSRMDDITGFETYSVMAAPLVFKGKILGAIELVTAKGGKAFSREQLELLELFADYAAVALANARNYKKLEKLTISDECTGLYNSRHLLTVMEKELIRFKRYKRPFSILFFDLDHFKKVNDIYGHLVGTNVLGEVGELVQSSLREVDIAFRYGGDEFVVVFPETGKRGAICAAYRIWRVIREHEFKVGNGLGLKLTASIGVAGVPDDEVEVEQLLKAADEAMYMAKARGRDSIFVAGMGKVVPGRENELKLIVEPPTRRAITV
ncbi:MAG: sensor domain-containing diguanylate cyclase [Deltaproteobacteria bacterium]|nr:sensor domain-containing diguanylate cyclase [Deltaproteobacteria bacterium]